MDYFIRTCCLVKHEMMWSTGYVVARDDFAKVASRRNAMNIGRFTVAPWLPKVKGAAKEARKGFMEFTDSEFFYGIR